MKLYITSHMGLWVASDLGVDSGFWHHYLCHIVISSDVGHPVQTSGTVNHCCWHLQESLYPQ